MTSSVHGTLVPVRRFASSNSFTINNLAPNQAEIASISTSADSSSISTCSTPPKVRSPAVRRIRAQRSTSFTTTLDPANRRAAMIMVRAKPIWVIRLVIAVAFWEQAWSFCWHFQIPIYVMYQLCKYTVRLVCATSFRVQLTAVSKRMTVCIYFVACNWQLPVLLYVRWHVFSAPVLCSLILSTTTIRRPYTAKHL